MNKNVQLSKKTAPEPGVDGIIKLAILAVGGQGGGVLSNWIVDLAERNNYRAQSTSIAGVAQRTGATIYYIEMLPRADQMPVLSLSAAPGDVDIVITAELMEAGRAIMRGFVTQDRTTLITSTHRAFATAEKIAPGNAIADADLVLDIARKSCENLVAFDMESIAIEAGTVVSASLFGALAGSGALPFDEQGFEETIKASGRGVEASLAAFRNSSSKARNNTEPTAKIEEPVDFAPKGPPALLQQWEQMQSRIRSMPLEAQSMANLGLRKVVDFQDLAYGVEYLDRVEQIISLDRNNGGPEKGFTLTATAAKYIANAMAYDDIIWVADIKTRKLRFDKIRNRVKQKQNNALRITEYFHPGGSEFCSLLPVAVGQFVEARPGLFKKVDWLVNRGRRVRTDTIFWFTALYMVSGLRRYRRKLLRHNVEQAHLDAWINTALSKVETNYDLAVEIIKCQRLIKGYSDTHKRGMSKFGTLLDGLKLVEDREDAADWVRRMRDAALDDVEGEKLEGTVETIRSFTKPSGE